MWEEGTEGADILTGSALDDQIFGQGGDDSVSGGDGNDWLSGGEGDDVLDGGDGDDLLSNEAGDDQLIGGAGDDTASLGGLPGGYDLVRALDGSFILTDRFGFWGTDTLVGIEHLDFGGYSMDLADLLAPGTGGDDELEGGAGIDWLYGLGGDDILRPGAGMNMIDGGDGDDTAVYAGNSSDYRIYTDPEGLLRVERITGDGDDPFLAGFDFLYGVEHIRFEGDLVTVNVADIPGVGTSGDDLVTGTALNDALFGLDGDDSLIGGAGDDILVGGAGNDSHWGGAGNDRIYEDWDGGGDDVFHYGVGDGDDVVWDEGGGSDTLVFGAGIDPLDVIVSLDDWGFGYTFSFVGEAGSITFRNAAGPNEAFALEEVHFADDTVWTAAQLYAMAGLGGG
jgi:Ca2+-binding RTX toxin-like protein